MAHFLAHRNASYHKIIRRARLEHLEEKRVLAVLTVSNLSDGPVVATGDLPGSLRQAIFDANAMASDDMIQFASGLSGTINLVAGEIPITDDLSISGPTTASLMIDAGAASRIFLIDDGVTTNQIAVSISNLTLTNGAVTGSGGAINSSEEVTLLETAITGNTASDDGGGIYASAEATTNILFSELTANDAGMSGGGAFLSDNGETRNRVEDSLIANNIAGEQGGGLRLNQTTNSRTTITRSTITGNSADDGGGIFTNNGGPFTGGGKTEIVDSTVSGNQATEGGGITAINVDRGETVVQRSTISGNTATSDGGGMKVQSQRQGTYYYYYQPYEYTYIPYDPETMTGGYGYGTGPYGPDYGYIAGSPGKTTVRDSTISGNDSQSDGGGIHSSNTSFGSSAYAYGFYDTTVELTNSTVSGNSATGEGGGIRSETSDYQSPIMKLNSSTVTGNTASIGGGISAPSQSFRFYQYADLSNSIVAANNATNPDIAGSANARYSLVGDDTGALLFVVTGSEIGTAGSPVDPLLGPLANNGGPTQTHALLTGSLAIDGGDPAFNPSLFTPALLEDQRGNGFPRVALGRVDMGAYETQVTLPADVVFIATNDGDTIDITETSSTIEVDLNGQILSYPLANLSSLEVRAKGGDDVVRRLGGTTFTVVVKGGNGNDRLEGNGAIDHLFGNAGRDLIKGGAGDDFIDGGIGYDTLRGGNGNDTIIGNKGNDRVFGQSGNDILSGNEGNDILVGGTGDDMISGEADEDVLIGGSGIDVMEGNNGGDLLIGGSTSIDNDAAQLDLLMAEWKSANGYNARVANLNDGSGTAGGGANGSLFLPDIVVADTDDDELSGNSSRDYFWGLQSEILDLAANELFDS